MKKLSLVIALGISMIISGAFAQTIQTEDQKRLEMAKEGCQKPIGFFPTPSKLMCALSALGISEKEAKPKALALVFGVCQGRVSQPVAGVTPKAYPTLGACLKDPQAVTLINKELTAKGFPEVKVVNPSILNVPITAPVTKPATAQ